MGARLIMEQYINKAAVVAEIDDMLNTKEHTSHCDEDSFNSGRWKALTKIKGFLNTLEVIDPYEQCIQYPTVKDGIKAHAEVYSFNIESELFNQLTKEQQELWRNEIEQAVISGGEVGVELTRDMRYKENLEVKEDVVSTDTPSPNSLKFSRHGDSHIEAMTEALRMEYEKGRADVLRNIKPEIDKHKTCGECGYYIPYMKTDGEKDSYGDCASIGMNNECFDGNNHFKDPDEELLQVEENEEACGYFKVNRPVRVRKYIKDNPIYSNKRSKKQ